MAFKTLFLILFVMVLAGCTAVPDTDISTPVPTRTPAPPVEMTTVPTAVLTYTPPPSSPTNLPTDTAVPVTPNLDDFLENLQTNLNQSYFEAVEAVMHPAFVTGNYPAAIGNAAARNVIAQLPRLLPPHPTIAFQEVDEAVLPEMLTAEALFANEAPHVAVVGSSGWGLGGSGNGLLYLIEEDGGYRWAGLVVTYGDFTASPTLENIMPPAGLIYEDSGHSWWQIDANGRANLLIQPHARITLNSGATMALAAEANSQSVTLIRFPEQVTETIPLDGRLMLDPSSIPWLDEDTAVLTITDEGMVVQGSTGPLALLDTQTGQLTRLEPEVSIYAQPSVTADGTIVYGVTPERELLVWRDGVALAVPITGLDNEIGYFANPILSHDGSKVGGTIATGSDLYPLSYVVAEMQQPGQTIVHPFMPAPTDAVLPWGINWSPDSQWLALAPPSWDAVEGGSWLVTANGTTKIFLGPGSQCPVWLDANRVVFSTFQDGKTGIQLYDISTGGRFWLDLPTYQATLSNGFWLAAPQNLCPVQYLHPES